MKPNADIDWCEFLLQMPGDDRNALTLEVLINHVPNRNSYAMPSGLSSRCILAPSAPIVC